MASWARSTTARWWTPSRTAWRRRSSADPPRCAGGRSARDRTAESAGKRQLTIGIVSLAAGIPITAISAGISHLPGLITAWAGIGAVNLAHALANRRRD